MQELERFRHEARQFAEANCPPSLRTPMVYPEDRAYAGRRSGMNPDQKAWLAAMVSRGWTVPEWPAEYGGAGLGKAEAAVLREELARIGARPPLEDYGITMLSPALMKYGTEAQRLEHLPKIARGEIRWCQGYSEPGAGSDLAGLMTRAEDKGDHFLVNGRKIWTSHAHMADWIFCLVRTDPTAPKHLGISVLLFDMSSAGVAARPLTLISGHRQFCEVTLDDVVVPKENLLGPLNGGWEIAKYILVFERQMYGAHASRNVDNQSASDLARAKIGLTDGRLADAGLRTDIIRHEIKKIAFEAARARIKADPSAGASRAPFLKLYGTEINKERQDLLMSIRGLSGLGWEGEEFDGGNEARTWLRSRGNSIEGGTSEIQLNLIAQRVLNLPKA